MRQGSAAILVSKRLIYWVEMTFYTIKDLGVKMKEKNALKEKEKKNKGTRKATSLSV